MTDQKPLVAFMFAYVSKRPSSERNIRTNASVSLQLGIIDKFVAKSGREVKRWIVGTSVYRRSPFTKSQKFLEAIEAATRLDCDLVLADVTELLGRTAMDQIDESAKALDTLEVNIWDATLNRQWHELPEITRQRIMVSSMRARATRSGSIKAGIKINGSQRGAPPASNGIKGSRVNKLKADKAALQLKEFVRREEAKLDPGETLSPAALARSLNQAGISASRGGEWSFNSAKNLIRRLVRTD